jgi:3-oxoacyl-[acyl-carrier protein] reductase
MSMNRLTEKVAVVTGSSRGIGAAIARLFAAHGAKVAIHGRDVTALSGVLDDIRKTGGRGVSLSAELTNYAQIEQLRDDVERLLGPVDVLVVNAGGSVTRPQPLEEISEEGWRASVDANLTSTFFTLKSFLPGMKERQSGSIITLSSAAARRAHPMSPIPYAAAKAGIQILTQHLATQVGPYGIRVNCIAPETILTERNEAQIPANIKERLTDEHPIRRLGTPEDVARAALYLASEESSWVTGIILDVAGGTVMR